MTVRLQFEDGQETEIDIKTGLAGVEEAILTLLQAEEYNYSQDIVASGLQLLQ